MMIPNYDPLLKLRAQPCHVWTCPCAFFPPSPDGDLRRFREPHRALESSVNLAHLHRSFKADHL